MKLGRTGAVAVMVKPMGGPITKTRIIQGVYGIFRVKQPAMEFLSRVPSFLTLSR